MKSNRSLQSPASILGATALALAMFVGAGSAKASPMATTFTWTPSALGGAFASAGTISNATGYTVNDFASITTDNTGNFTESGAPSILNFTNASGNTVSAAGLNSTYSLYLMFTATGNQGGPTPAPGNTVTGTFSTLSFALYATPSDPNFTVTSTGVTVSNNAGAEVIATGSLIPGPGNTVSLTNEGGNPNQFSPKADLVASFNPCVSAAQGNVEGTCFGNASSFFTAPVGGMQFAIGDFSATTSRTTLNGNNLQISGGGGNVTQEILVPEPVSLVLLGSGLLATGIVRRKSRKAK